MTDAPDARVPVEHGEDTLRAIVQGMPVLLDAFDENGLIVAWNAECERVTGYAASEIIRNPGAMSLLYPDESYRAEMLAAAAHLRHQSYDDFWVLTAKDGTTRTIHWFNVGARVAIPGWTEWSVGIDVTERRRLEGALRDATLAERKRLAGELHDGLGQELTGLALLAAACAARATDFDSKLAADLERLKTIASAAIRTCGAIARGLGPIWSAPDGLHEALGALVASLTAADGARKFAYVADISAPVHISLDACNHLYRIVQEAASNAIRHAEAAHIHVRLTVESGAVCIEIADDGVGIATPRRTGAGLGLRTMQDRAHAIRGTLIVTGATGGGTLIRCTCPNRPAPAEGATSRPSV